MPAIVRYVSSFWHNVRVVGNWHKIPWVSRLMCRMGRHDYEPDYPSVEGRWLCLRCFYCGARRRSATDGVGPW